MSNLVTRTISGAVYISIIIASLLIHPICFGCVFLVFTALSLWEFYSITDKLNTHNRLWGSVAGAVLFLCCFLSGYMRFGYNVFAIYILLIIGLLVAELFRKAENPIRNWANLILGQVMVAVPFASLNYIMFGGMNELSTLSVGSRSIVVLALFVIIWTNDTGAYCVGSLFGRHKMFPRVSPGKSWEGLIGGFVFALLAGWIFSMFFGFSGAKYVNVAAWLAFALIVCVFGTLGDLMESLTKRTLGIKDSGNIIPGHGGMLDRFDSMLLAAPAIAVYLMLLVG